MNAADPTPTGLLLLRTWLPSDLHDEFSAWCDDHHRELLTVPGFLRARRFAFVAGGGGIDASDPAQFLTMYETTDISVLTSDEYIEHGRNSTGLPQFLTGELRMSRLDCELESGTPSVWWPATVKHELLMVTHPDGEPFSGPGSTGNSTVPISMRAYRASQGPRVLLAEPTGDSAVDNSAIDDITTSTDQWSRWRCVFGESAPASAF
jgi:hypothetical protein